MSCVFSKSHPSDALKGLAKHQCREPGIQQAQLCRRSSVKDPFNFIIASCLVLDWVLMRGLSSSSGHKVTQCVVEVGKRSIPLVSVPDAWFCSGGWKTIWIKPSYLLPLWKALRAIVKPFVLSFSICHRLQLHSSSNCYGYWYWVVWALAICFSGKSRGLAQTTLNACLNWATWFSTEVNKEQSLILSSVLAVVAVTIIVFLWFFKKQWAFCHNWAQGIIQGRNSYSYIASHAAETQHN